MTYLLESAFPYKELKISMTKAEEQGLQTFLKVQGCTYEWRNQELGRPTFRSKWAVHLVQESTQVS